MSEFLGSRISLISKSDIRYVGVLHEIDSEKSTVSLENVKSFGTEGRKGKPEEEIAPSDQIYEFIIFRGSDVKDLRIEEAPVKENQPPPAVPNDPAIVGARPRPTAATPSGPPPPFAGNPYFPPQGNWPGRGGPPGPGGPGGPSGPGGPGGHGFNGFPYHPPHPQGWFLPGQGFPPSGLGPWGNYYPPPGAVPPPGPAPVGRQPQGPQHQEQKPAPIGAGVDKSKSDSTTPAPETAPQAPKPIGHPIQKAATPAPTPPVESKPSVEEVISTAASLSVAESSNAATAADGTIPTGPKMTRITPAVPLPAALTNKAAAQQVIANALKQTNDQPLNINNAAALRDATQAAKAAVAVAMAKLEGKPAPPTYQQPNNNGLDNLSKKVNEMRVSAFTSRGAANSRGGVSSRGRGGPRQAKVDVPDSDFDFASSNAKFNKTNLIKEAIAGSPLSETPNAALTADGTDEAANPPLAYNKASSFFDNISSEAKERAENGGQKPGGREWRGEEQRKNIETFGQGSVDGGYRNGGGYRGRGRGRGGMRGRGGYGGRSGGGNRGPRYPRSEAQPAAQ